MVTAIGCMMYAKIFDVSQESSVIYKWRHVLASAQYSYKVVLLTQNEALREYLKFEQPQRDVQILDLLKNTLNLDGDVSSKQKSLKHYKYRFLNGLKVPEDTKYYVKDFVYSPDGKILVGLNWFNADCLESEALCGVLLFDMNGPKSPNRFGLDVFGVNIYHDRLEPFGTGLSYENNERNCRHLETGVTCSRFYLMGGQFFK